MAIARWPNICAALALLLALSGAATAEAQPRWERANAAALHQNVPIAICLPSEEEIICAGIGCRQKGGYDFVEMITGNTGWKDRRD
jgi:hypothetical protein